MRKSWNIEEKLMLTLIFLEYKQTLILILFALDIERINTCTTKIKKIKGFRKKKSLKIFLYHLAYSLKA